MSNENEQTLVNTETGVKPPLGPINNSALLPNKFDTYQKCKGGERVKMGNTNSIFSIMDRSHTTTHICFDKDMFNTYQKCKCDERVKMGNTNSSKILGHGKVILKMSSGHEITLNNVKHVPDMSKNLISGTLISKAGFCVNFLSDKLVLKKNGVYLGKSFVKGGLVKMNVMTTIPKKSCNQCFHE